MKFAGSWHRSYQRFRLLPVACTTCCLHPYFEYRTPEDAAREANCPADHPPRDGGQEDGAQERKATPEESGEQQQGQRSPAAESPAASQRYRGFVLTEVPWGSPDGKPISLHTDRSEALDALYTLRANQTRLDFCTGPEKHVEKVPLISAFRPTGKPKDLKPLTSILLCIDDSDSMMSGSGPIIAPDGSLFTYFGQNWLDQTKDAVRRLSQWQLDTSWDLKERMVREALTSAGQMTPFTDGELPRAIARDVGVASILHAIASHNLLVWLRSRGDKSAHEDFMAALDTSPLRPASPADMLAARRLTEPLLLLLKQVVWLEQYLLSPRNGPEKQRAAARAALEEPIHCILFILHLHELEAGDMHAILPSVLRTDTQEAVEKLWRAHTEVEPRTPKRLTGEIDTSYHWYVKTGHGRNHRKPLRSVIAELCPKQFAMLYRSGTGASTFEAGVARLIAHNPLDFITRLPVFPWQQSRMRPQALPAHVKLSWEELAPLLSERYWVLHDKLAASLAHSLCRLVTTPSKRPTGVHATCWSAGTSICSGAMTSVWDWIEKRR